MSVCNTHVLAIDHFPALPPGEQQDAEHHRGQHDSCRQNGLAALAVADEEIDDFDDHGNDVTASVPPSRAQRTDLSIAHYIDEAGDRRKPSHDKARTE